MPRDKEQEDELIRYAEKISELDLSDPNALDALGEIPEFDIPPSPPESFVIAANAKLSLEECQEKLSGKLHETFEGQNLIFPAINSGDCPRVQWLVEDVGLDPHQVCDNGYTTLTRAVYQIAKGDHQIFEYFLGLGVDLNQQSDWSESPLKYSVHSGNYEWALKLIEIGADASLINFTPLHQAAAGGNLDLVQSLALPETIEIRDAWERTPWLTAMTANQLEAALLLEGLGADTNARGHLDASPLFLCAWADALQTSLHLIEKEEQAGTLQEHLKIQNNFGDTALHEAADHDSLKVAELLLENGASLDIENSVNMKPINRASSLQAIKLLHQFGADLNSVDGCGEWPLKSMAEDGDLAAVRWLLKNGAQIDRTSTGLTALHAALNYDALDVAAYLIEAGAEVNAQDVDGDGVYFYCRSAAAVDLMLHAGADPDLLNQIGEPASASSYVSQEARDRLLQLKS